MTDQNPTAQAELASSAPVALTTPANRAFLDVLDSVPGAWFLTRKDGSFAYVNDQACAGLGYCRSEMLQRNIFDIDPHVTPDRWAAIWNATTTQDSRVFRTAHVGRDGSRLPVEIRSCRAWIDAEDLVVSYSIDLRASEQLRLTLADTEAQLQRLIAHLPDLVFRLQLQPKPAFEFVSPAAERLLGYTPRQLCEMQSVLEQLVHPEDRALVLALGQLPAGAGQKLRFLQRDGSLVWLDVRCSVVTTVPQLVIEGVARDVTRSQVMEEQLRQGQKMKALGQLAGGIAHDFNNLLQVIRASAQVLETLGLEQEAEPLLVEIAGATERAGNLVQQLLTFSRRGSVEFAPLDLALVISNLHQMLERLLGEQVELLSTTAGGPAWVSGNQTQLEQVIINLCVNARDAMPRGGKLELGVRRRSNDPVPFGKDVSSNPASRDAVELWVTDSGEGMSAAVQQSLFEPFFTTKEPGRGSGLGLATVYAVVQAHGGCIRVESSPGAGSTFRVFLPHAPSKSNAERSDDP